MRCGPPYYASATSAAAGGLGPTEPPVLPAVYNKTGPILHVPLLQQCTAVSADPFLPRRQHGDTVFEAEGLLPSLGDLLQQQRDKEVRPGSVQSHAACCLGSLPAWLPPFPS